MRRIVNKRIESCIPSWRLRRHHVLFEWILLTWGLSEEEHYRHCREYDHAHGKQSRDDCLFKLHVGYLGATEDLKACELLIRISKPSDGCAGVFAVLPLPINRAVKISPKAWISGLDQGPTKHEIRNTMR